MRNFIIGSVLIFGLIVGGILIRKLQDSVSQARYEREKAETEQARAQREQDRIRAAEEAKRIAAEFAANEDAAKKFAIKRFTKNLVELEEATRRKDWATAWDRLPGLHKEFTPIVYSSRAGEPAMQKLKAAWTSRTACWNPTWQMFVPPKRQMP